MKTKYPLLLILALLSLLLSSNIVGKTLSNDSTPIYFVIHGYVQYKDSKQPVPNVTVANEYEDQKVVTDSQGYFEFNSDPKYIVHSIRVIDDNLYSPRLKIDGSTKTTADVILEVKPGGKIKGRVINQLKEPIENAYLYSYIEIPNQPIIYGSIETHTNSNGEFIISKLDLDASSYKLTIAAKGYNQKDQTNIHFPPGQNEIYVTISLTSTEVNSELGTVSGIVTNETGSPIEGAIVAGSNALSTHVISDPFNTTSTNSQGLFSLEKVPLKDSIILANAKGYAPAWKQVNSSKDTVLHLTLPASHYVGGKIVSIDRNPIKYAQIHLHLSYVESSTLEGYSLNVWELFRNIVKDFYQSDTEGRFRIEGLLGNNISMDFMDYGYTSIQDTTLDLDRDDYVITLLSPGQISGLVLDDESGKPVSPFHLTVGKSRDNPYGKINYSGTTPFEIGGLWVYKEDGKFVIPKLEADLNYKIEVKAEGYRQENIDPVCPTTDTTEKNNRLEIRLKKIKPTVGSVVENLTGKAVSGVVVTVIQPNTEQYMSYNWEYIANGSVTTTDANGHFRFSDIPYSRGIVALKKPGYGSTMLFNVDYSKYIEARLPKAASITVIPKKLSETSLDTVQIYLQKLDPLSTFFETNTPNKEGKYFWKDLSPGSYSVSIHKNEKDHNPLNYQVVLNEGQNLVLDLTGPPPVRIFGKVTWKGISANPAYIFAYNQDSTIFSSNAATDKDGNYEVIFSVPGNYRLIFNKSISEPTPRFTSTYRTLSVDSGEYRIDCNLPDSAIQGLLMESKTGKPLASIPVIAYQQKKGYDNYSLSPSAHCDYTTATWSTFKTTTTDLNGKFTFEPLDPGIWMLAMEKEPGISYAGKPFQLKTNDVKDNVVLIVPEMGSLELSVLDEDSGNRLLPLESGCSDSSGYLYQPTLEKQDSTGNVIYSLPPGKYKVYAMTENHTPGFAELEIQAGKTTQAALKLKKGGRLVFHINGKSNIPKNAKVFCICRILQSKNGAPVLQDTNGGYKRYVFYINPNSPDSTTLPIPPGDYTVEVQTKEAFNTAMRALPISRQTRLLKIEQGKDILWEISLNNLIK